MKRRSFLAPTTGQSPTPDDRAVQAAMAHFKHRVERNKTRRRRDGDPPAALPLPTDKPRGGGLSGGAAAALVFDD